MSFLFGELRMANRKSLITINGASVGKSNWDIPLSYMRAETFNVVLNGQDLDSYRDTNGVLHRNALTNCAPKIEFEIPFGTKFGSFMSELRSRYVNATEKKVNATVYIPELNKYVTHDFYVPDIENNVYTITEKGTVYYNQTRIAFISYGGAV